MKNVLLIGVCIGLLVLNACNEKEDPVNPLVGEWIVGSYTYTNMKAGYERFEGNELLSYYNDEESHTMTLNADLTYTRGLTLLSSDPLTEDGEWEQDAEFLDFDPTGLGIGLPKSYEIIDQDNNDIIVSATVTDFLIPQNYYDTVSQPYIDYVDSLFTAADGGNNQEATNKYIEEINRIFQETTYDLKIEFDKVN